jgi:hypothetical protein
MLAFGVWSNMPLAIPSEHGYTIVRGRPPQSLGSGPLIIFDPRGVPGNIPGAILEHFWGIPGREAARNAQILCSGSAPGMFPGAPRGSNIIKGLDPRLRRGLLLTNI